MLRYPADWVVAMTNALADLAHRPWALFLVLFAINAIAQPYAGITHDARLYSVQVLNRVHPGDYADDIFFRYGSQDDYSLFSRFAAPLVHAFGLSAAFFVIYLLSKSLLLFGMIRIVLRLVPGPAAAALGLIYCAIFMIHYGGHHMLFVQENFVTPRMLACACVLVGFDLMLGSRPLASGLAIAFALALHPLMAFGGLLVWAGYHVWKFAGVWTLLGLAALMGTAGVVLLGVESLGVRFFGAMDDEWRQTIMTASPFNFPSLWSWTDWANLAFQLVILGVVIAKYWTVDPARARFLLLLLIVTIAGALGAALAEQLPYALFQQGQPYRALWMLGFLHLPFAIWLCAEWSQGTRWQRAASCALLAYLCCVNAMPVEHLLPLLLFPVVAVALRGLDREPIHPEWLLRSVQVSLVAGALLWAAYKGLLLIQGYEALAYRHAEKRDVLDVFLRNLGPVTLGLLTCWLLARTWNPRRAVALGLIGLALQLAAVLVPETTWYRENCTHYRGDLTRVHDILRHERGGSKRLPTVYCNLGCLDYVWLDLHSQSYFDWWQAGNFMFCREMAMEGRRRARLVGPCEIAHYRQYEDQLSPGYMAVIARFFQTDFTQSLGKDELTLLCQEPDLDYLVLDQHVEGVPSVQLGRLYLYSCADVRTAVRTRTDDLQVASTP